MAVTLTSSRYFPSASAVTTTGDNTLANATNVYSENDSYATVSSGGLVKNESSDSYKFSNFGIGSEINSDCTITDIKYEVQFHDADVVADSKITLQQSNSSGTTSDTYSLVSTKNTDDDSWQEVVNANPLWGYSGASDPDNLKNSSYGIIATIGNNSVDKEANGFVDAIALSFSYELHLDASIQGSSSSSAQLETEIILDSSERVSDNLIVDAGFSDLANNWIQDSANNGTTQQVTVNFFFACEFTLGSDLEESLSQVHTVKNGQEFSFNAVVGSSGTFTLNIGTSGDPTKYASSSVTNQLIYSFAETFKISANSQEEELLITLKLSGSDGSTGSFLLPDLRKINSIVSVAEGELQTEINLSGSLLAAANTSAALQTEIVLSGSADGASSASAELELPSNNTELDGSATGSAIASAELETSVTLAGNSSGASQATAELETAIEFSASAAGSSLSSAEIETEISFVASVSGTSISNANLETEILFNASIEGTSLVSGVLQTGVVNSITGSVSVQFLEDKYSVLVEQKEKYSVALVGSEKYNVTKEN